MATSESPPFWFERPGLKAWALWPLSWLYSRAARMNMRARPSGSAGVPVLCVGNFVVGGGGKTPTALALGKAALERGLKPGFLSRGYGGRVSAPTLVDPGTHVARTVGDEPLLLAEIAPTVVSADRVAGARLLVEHGCDFIIMDDGFQNPKLRKDFSLVVVDSRRGIGNGYPMPAGPLRVRMRDQLPLADAILVVGNADGADAVIRRAAKAGKPVHLAHARMLDGARWKGRWILPFAGIADPQKFFESLKRAGAEIAHVRAFSDHHFYTDDDVAELFDRAKLMKAALVTTAKDLVRLKGMGKAQEALSAEVEVSEIDLVFEDPRLPSIIIAETIERFEHFQLSHGRG